MRDELPKRPHRNECGILNLDSHHGPGTHWTAYYKNGRYIEYFDPFGDLQPPLELLDYLGSRIFYNHEQYQTYNTFNCGHLSLEFLLNKYFNKD